MRLRKLRRTHNSGWRVARRCVIFFTVICLVPVFLVFIVATDHYIRPVRPMSFGMRKPFTEDRHIPFHDLKNKNLSVVAKRLDFRQKYLKKTCRILGLDKVGNDSLHKPNPWEYLINEKHHLVWCNVFKAASTSWMYNFNILAGYSPKFLRNSRTPPMTLARQKYGRPSLSALKRSLNGSLSFLIARHPLERLLSAYRDKIQYAVPGSVHRKLGKKIIWKYRKKTASDSPVYPTYPEFVDWLVHSVRTGHSLDMHWTPIVEFCTPCMFNIQIIAHTETLEEDQAFLIKKAGLEKIIKPQWKNAGKGSTTAQIHKHYSQLTRSQILQLYHIYRFDFELFNYSLNGYLELGQPDSDPSKLLAAITMKDNNPNSVPQIY